MAKQRQNGSLPMMSTQVPVNQRSVIPRDLDFKSRKTSASHAHLAVARVLNMRDLDSLRKELSKLHAKKSQKNRHTKKYTQKNRQTNYKGNLLLVGLYLVSLLYGEGEIIGTVG